MARPRNINPTYTHHKQSGRGRLVWTDATGVRQQKLLPGPFGSAESKAAKALLELQLASGQNINLAADAADTTINELCAAYIRYAENHYRDVAGNLTSEYRETLLVSKTLRKLYGDTIVVEFGPLKLKATRQAWVNAGLSRSECNRRANLVRRIMKWGAAEELIPATVYQALITVNGLQRGRTNAPETEPVTPVAGDVVDATLPYLSRVVRAMVELQRITGMRPGEVCVIRRCDIDAGGAVWMYRPATHKTAWRGKTRVIAIGPKAQALLREFFVNDHDAYLFSPRTAADEHLATRTANRKTPRYPSHLKRNAAKRVATPKRVPKERYDTQSYGRAIKRAVARANVEREKTAKKTGTKYTLIPHWAPNQLRHTFATEVRKVHGLEAAQVLLGHTRADVTQVYAERNEALATKVAAQIG